MNKVFAVDDSNLGLDKWFDYERIDNWIAAILKSLVIYKMSVIFLFYLFAVKAVLRKMQ